MRKSDVPFKISLLTALVVLLASSTWAIKRGQQVTATAINGLAFYDCNANGIRDNNEPTFANVGVTLSGRTTTGDSVNVSTTTNASGNYSFVGLAAGQFVVKFAFPNGSTGLNFTTKNTAINGSDANPNGATDPLSIDGLTDVQGIDVGIIDRIAPVVTFVNPFLTPYANGDTITVECDNLPTMNASWATAQDNSGAPVTVQFIDLAISVNNCSTTGYITILDCIFRATDTCGNVGQKAVFVKVKDSKAPVLAGIPTDITVNTTRGERIPTAASANVVGTDNCSQNPVATTVLDTEVTNTCGKIITRTWSASDDCGNIVRGVQRITVISNISCPNPLPIDTFHLVLSSNRVLDTCFNLPTGSVISNIRHCGTGLANATITLTASNCIRVTPSVNFVGRDTFCARVCDVNGLNCRDITFMLNVQALRFTECNILSGMKNINLMPLVCGENACYCIVGQTDIRTLRNDYTVTDNGRPYDGGYSGCQFDTIFSYNYFTVPEMGTNGPYGLDSWAVNGTTRQIAAFQTMQQLVDSMNIWDPMGNWRIDATRFLIFGGDSRSTYGQMRITRLSNSAFGVLELNRGLISNGVKLCFSTGSHTIIFQNNVTGCADTLRANVFCENSNRAPIVLNDRFLTPKNTPIRLDVMLNDTLNGVFQSLVAVNQPSRGVVGFQDARTFLYTPNTDFCGRDSFDYQLCNAFGLCSTGRVFMTVTCDTTVNNSNRPVAVDDLATTRLNTATTISVLANDTLNGALTRPLSIVRFQMHGSGNVVDNQIVYTPVSGFCNGRDSFDYEICNANGCDIGRVVVNVTCENDTTNGRKPVAVDDVVTTRLNTALTVSPLANDTLNGTLTRPLSITRFQMHGSVNVINNQILYTPTAGFCNGRDSFDYEICTINGCDTGRVVVNITCEGDTMVGGMLRPVAVDDNVTARLNVALMIDVLANDTTRSNLIRAINITRFQNNGTVNVINNGILYTPNLGFCGDRDTFDYEICNANGCDTGRVIVNVTCENDGSGRPVAVDDRITTRLDSRVAINVLSNDILNGFLTRPINVSINPRHGIAFISNNEIQYIPNALFCGGNDTLDYVICNAIGCDTASVIITITCGNDTMVNNRRKPVAVDDRVSTRLNTSLTVTPLTNDSLNGVLVRPLSIIGAANRGTAFTMGNQIMYVPTTGFCGGNDTLNYEICNSNGCDTGQIFIAISCDNGLPKPIAVDDTARTRVNTSVTVDVLANDTRNGALTGPLSISSPARHGSAQVVNNQIVYTPTMGYCDANDTLDYEICNVNGCDTGQVIITISCGIASPKPIAVDDAARTRVNTSVTVDVLANDTRNGALAGPLSISSPARHGSAQVVNNQIIYTPRMGYCGANDTLDYEICNINGCDTGRLIVVIACDSIPNGGSGPPIVAVNDNVTTRKNTSTTFRPTLNDTVRTKLLSLMIAGGPRNGTIAFSGLDTLLYTPNLDFCGRDTIAYMICDTSFRCADAFIFINVNCDTTVADTRKPRAGNDFSTTQKGRAVTISVLANDSLYGTLIRPVTVLQTPRRGSALVQNNQIVYTPNADFCGGQDSLLYEICNANGCDTAKVYIAVTCDTTVNNGSNRPIVAVNDVISTRKNVQITFRPTINDTIRTRLLALMVINNPLHGTVSFTGLDTLIYVPNRDYCGRDTFEYSICDTSFNCANAFIYVNVSCDSAVNPLAPIAVNDTARTGVNQAVVVSVLQNDTLRGALSRPLSITSRPRFGTATVDRNNQVIYTPQTGFCGSRDTLSYEICTINGCDTAIVSINVICDSNTLRRLPVAVPDYATARKRTPIRISILTNDTLNGTLDSIRILTAPRRGTASIGTDNVLTYATDTCGFADTLIYRICNRNGCDTALVSINVPCQTDTTGGGRLLPIAVNDTTQTLVNQPVTISVLGNDTLNGVLVGRVGITSRPRFGFALVNGNNQIVYTPQNSFCGGRDTLMYEICNANGCDTAIVSINVTCDALTATRPPVAVFDVATTPKNTPIRIAILANDTLNGTLDSIKIIRSPLLGMASLDGNNILTYTPDSCGFTDSLIYRICNRNGCDTAIVYIKVTCDTVITNLLPPVAVFDTARTAKGVTVTVNILLNDTLRGADTFRITRRPLNGLAIFDANRQIAYTPDALYCGNDTLIYEICNQRGCDTAIVFIKVVCDTTPLLRPTAVDDAVKTTINRQVDFVILGNDTLRGARSAEMVSPPSHGTILIMPDSMAMYKPDKEFCGRDSFLYRICNTVGCDTAWVKIEVSCGDTLQVFRGFSPNNDRINDVLVIRGIENYPDNEVLIFNRWGNQVFTRKGYRNEDGWDGSWNGKFTPDGTYFYFIKLNDPKNQQFSGYIQLVR